MEMNYTEAKSVDIENSPTDDGKIPTDDGKMPRDDPFRNASKMIIQYLMARVPEFCELQKIRKQGWENPQGDSHFQRQRRNADKANAKNARYFYKMMETIGNEIQNVTKVFSLPEDGDNTHPKILDTCMAPGGFLKSALARNPTAKALGFTLPTEDGGHEVLLPNDFDVERRFLDVTMLAEDMGVTDIPFNHPDAARFLPLQLQPDEFFDLVICDGQVLRTHSRPEYREKCEARRLSSVQLALGLSHMRPGGSMLVLLHKLEAWNTLLLVYKFTQFSKVTLYKPIKTHLTRSSFYMIATDIQSQQPEAIRTVGDLKSIWSAATFYNADNAPSLAPIVEDPSVERVLDVFGPELIRQGRQVWATQATGLANARFNKHK